MAFFFFLTYYILLNLEVVTVSSVDYRKFKPLKIVPVWDIFVCIRPDFLCYDSHLGFVVFFSLSL